MKSKLVQIKIHILLSSIQITLIKVKMIYFKYKKIQMKILQIKKDSLLKMHFAIFVALFLKKLVTIIKLFKKHIILLNNCLQKIKNCKKN